MKYKHVLIIFLLGALAVIIGALFKIQHWTGATPFLVTGMGLEALSVVMLIIKLLMSNNNNSRLNK